MRDRERVLSVLREWVVKAENDFKNAVHTLKLGVDCPTDTVCFHAQQCVEISIEEQRLLTGYATGARYPGWGEIPLAEARQAAAIARRIRNEVRALLPKESLLRRKT